MAGNGADSLAGTSSADDVSAPLVPPLDDAVLPEDAAALFFARLELAGDARELQQHSKTSTDATIGKSAIVRRPNSTTPFNRDRERRGAAQTGRRHLAKL
jgi:hypothetical protein